MTLPEAVDKAAREAAEVLAERGKSGFYGEVAVRFQADRIVTIEVKETIRAT